MALITINGTPLPTPSDFDIGIMDISKAERNANGKMIIERIATKRKIQLKYKFLDRATMSTLLKAVSDTYFDVTYPDPQTNANRTGSFYCGDRNVGILDYFNSIPRYKDCSFDLVER